MFPITFFDAASGGRINVCGRSTLTYSFECWGLAAGATAWNPYSFPSTFNVQNIPYRFIGFIYSNKMWVVGDDNPKVIDLTSTTLNSGVFTGATAFNFWDSSLNLPTIPQNNRTDGAGCAVVVGDYVYLFGGYNTNAVRRMYLKNLPTLTPDTTFPRKWDYLLDVPSTGSVSTYCAAIPTNRNQIMIEVNPTDASSNTALIYDIYQNTFAPLVSTFDISGTPLNELCHTVDPPPLYAFPYGNGARTFTFGVGTGSGVWAALPSAGSLTSTHNNYPALVLVPRGYFTAFTGLTACVGC
jgi:hypothetical protein